MCLRAFFSTSPRAQELQRQGRLAGPLVVNLTLNYSISTISLASVGHLGTTELAAAALVNPQKSQDPVMHKPKASLSRYSLPSVYGLVRYVWSSAPLDSIRTQCQARSATWVPHGSVLGRHSG